MDKLTPGILKGFQALVARANKDNLQMVLVTPGPHSQHYGSVIELNADFIRFRTALGAEVVAPWAPGTYIELTQTQIVPIAKTKTKGA